MRYFPNFSEDYSNLIEEVSPEAYDILESIGNTTRPYNEDACDIVGVFGWSESPEGVGFWSDVHEAIIKLTEKSECRAKQFPFPNFSEDYVKAIKKVSPEVYDILDNVGDSNVNYNDDASNLMGVFSWSESPEGFDFWSEVYDRVEKMLSKCEKQFPFPNFPEDYVKAIKETSPEAYDILERFGDKMPCYSDGAETLDEAFTWDVSPQGGKYWASICNKIENVIDEDDGDENSEDDSVVYPELHEIDLGDPINHPEHYTSHPSGIECIQVTEHMSFCVGNVFKYLWRAGLKGENELEDAKKAEWYLKRHIEMLEKRKL